MRDILEAARYAVECLHGRSRENLDTDAMLRSSVIYQLLIVGEATKRVSEELRGEWTSVPWRAMAFMRDRLIHAYHEVDLDEVWRTVQDDLPSVVESLRQLTGQDSVQ